MEEILRQEARCLFQSNTHIQAYHNDAISSGKLSKFYTLLIAHLLCKDDFENEIMAFLEIKELNWKIFVDTIWGYSLSLIEGSISFNKLAKLIAEISEKNLLEVSLFFNALPDSLLEAAKLEKKTVLEKKAQRAYTKFHYDQQKKVLIRDSNEGFAKLCILLATVTTYPSPELVWGKVLCLIGHYDLDPDRIVDLIISTYMEANSSICLYLLKYFNPQSITTVIWNKMSKSLFPVITDQLIYTGKVENFLTHSHEICKEIEKRINPKFIGLFCKLIKEGALSFDSFLPYFGPSDEVFETHRIKKIQNGREKISKSFILAMSELTEIEQERLKQEENIVFLGQMLYSPKLALINGFVLENDWENFSKMWEVYETKIDLIMYQPLLKSLLDMLEWMIHPLYSKVSYSKFFSNVDLEIESFAVNKAFDKVEEKKEMSQIFSLNENEFMKIWRIFCVIKIYIGFSSKVFIKVCRIFYKIIKEPELFNLPKFNQNSKIFEQVQTIVKEYLLPAISLQESNPSLSNELYKVLNLFDYRFRYQCYLYCYSEGITNNPYLANVFYKTRNEQIVIVNNLSEKNKKIFMKKLAKLTHNQPLQTFYWIFRRILLEDYDKMVPEIVKALGNCCNMALEMSIFNALYILNEQKLPTTNFKTGEQSSWFKNLTNFIALFSRKYLEIDIQPVFDYVMMKIEEPICLFEESEELPNGFLKLLHEILSKMYCNFVLKEVNKSKLEELCAGPKLQLEIMDISKEIKASKKSKGALENFFWKKSENQEEGESLAMNLFVLLSQKRSELAHKSYLSNIQIVGNIHDDYTVLIIQLIRVLKQLSSGYEQYQKLLPENSLDLLINTYKLPIEIAFEIFRPSVEHISFISRHEWVNLVNKMSVIFDKFASCKEKLIDKDLKNSKVRGYLNENFMKIGSVLSYEFFTTFWMLSLDSVYFPSKLYEEKIKEIKVCEFANEKKVEFKNKHRSSKSLEEVENCKRLLIELKNEEELQVKKISHTFHEEKVSRFQVKFLENESKKETHIKTFAEIFVQVCLLPRMMLDPMEALYCAKFILEVIILNSLTPENGIKLFISIVEYVMSYLPYSTERESAECLSIFLSEMLKNFSNWNDLEKLKIDLRKNLGIDEIFTEENYERLKGEFVRLFVRFGNIITSIKDEPYCIRNCLLLLEKIMIVPAFKKQAEDFEDYLKQLKEKYSTILPTIIEMQLSIMASIKKTLPVVEEQILSYENNNYFLDDCEAIQIKDINSDCETECNKRSEIEKERNKLEVSVDKLGCTEVEQFQECEEWNEFKVEILESVDGQSEVSIHDMINKEPQNETMCIPVLDPSIDQLLLASREEEQQQEQEQKQEEEEELENQSKEMMDEKNEKVNSVITDSSFNDFLIAKKNESVENEENSKFSTFENSQKEEENYSRNLKLPSKQRSKSINPLSSMHGIIKSAYEKNIDFDTIIDSQTLSLSQEEGKYENNEESIIRRQRFRLERGEEISNPLNPLIIGENECWKEEKMMIMEEIKENGEKECEEESNKSRTQTCLPRYSYNEFDSTKRKLTKAKVSKSNTSIAEPKRKLRKSKVLGGNYNGSGEQTKNRRSNRKK